MQPFWPKDQLVVNGEIPVLRLSIRCTGGDTWNSLSDFCVFPEDITNPNPNTGRNADWNRAPILNAAASTPARGAARNDGNAFADAARNDGNTFANAMDQSGASNVVYGYSAALAVAVLALL